MKRNQFMAGAVAFLAAPLATFSQQPTNRAEKGFKIKAGEGRIHGHIKLKGVNENVLDLKVSGRDTDGGFAMFEQTSLTQGMGTPLHVHTMQDEIFFVIDGHYYFQVGEDKYQLSTGDSIFLPMKVPHAWTQVSEKGKMTVTFQPAGKMEDFFVSLAAMQKPPTPAEMAKLFLDNNMQIVGPPLTIQ